MKQKTIVDKTFKVVADCMDTIFNEEDAWDANDYTPHERLEFVEQLNSKQYKKLRSFLRQCLNYLIPLKL